MASKRPRFARLRKAPAPGVPGGVTAGQPSRLRWQAEAIADVLGGDAQIPVRPLLCVHGDRGWLAGPLPMVQDVRSATLREVPDIVRRLLEVLRPAV